MKKENLIAQLEGAKALSSQVDIDKVIELIQALEPEKPVVNEKVLTQEVADRIAADIALMLYDAAHELVDTDGIELSFGYGREVEIDHASLHVDNTMYRITSIIDSFVIEEEEDGFIHAQFEAAEGILRDVDADESE